MDAVTDWLRTFLGAADLATDQVTRFADELAELRAQWSARLSVHRIGQGVREVPRADSAVARLTEILPEAPLVTTNTVRRMLNVSAPAACKAVEELADSGVVTRKCLERGTTGFFARDVVELLNPGPDISAAGRYQKSRSSIMTRAESPATSCSAARTAFLTGSE